MANNFCTNCGAPLNPAAKFCGKCGTRILPAAVERQTQPQQKPSESAAAVQFESATAVQPDNYKYIIPAQYKKGLLSQKPCSLVFSDTEVIVAMVDNNLMQQHMKNTKESVRGEKFLKRTAAVMKAGYTYSDKYWNMSRNQIIGEVSGNFIIANNTVQQARFSKGTMTSYADDTSSTTPPALVLKTVGGKFSFSFSTTPDTKTFLPMLMTTFPGRYKGPKR